MRIKKKIKSFMPLKVWNFCVNAKFLIEKALGSALFFSFRIFPLKDKVVATTMRGRKYGDNPQFILEKLHSLDESLDLVWLTNDDYSFSTPNWIRQISYFKKKLRLVYELATAKVWVNTHHFQFWWRKRNGQLVIQTWHGGLGIKKIEHDKDVGVPGILSQYELKNTCNLADFFITQSDHLTTIYRNAFGYKGPIFKCGFPKNDMLVNADLTGKKEIILEKFHLKGKKILLYVPTFRDSLGKTKELDSDVYNVDWNRLHNALNTKFGGDWFFLIKFHPIMLKYVNDSYFKSIPYSANVTSYSDTQELIMASDIVLSDYSSCIFDAALLNIPCFTFASDFDAYKSDRGVYYEMDELPFPYARNNDDLIANISNYDYKSYLNKWKAFKNQTGLYETGHAAEDVANKINQFIKTGKLEWSTKDLTM